MAAIRALREARASTGLADGRTEKRKSPPAMTNSHNPPNRAFEAESAARTSTSASTSDSPAMALSFVEMDAVNEHDGDGGDIQDADGEINEDRYIANEEDEEDDVNGDRMTMDATSRTTGVPSHPLGEMAIHSNLVDADRADNHGHDGKANDDDNRTGVNSTDMEVVLGGFVVNEEEYENDEDGDNRMTMDVISKTGVASHRPNEMEIQVDENADADAHAGTANSDAHDDIGSK